MRVGVGGRGRGGLLSVGVCVFGGGGAAASDATESVGQPHRGSEAAATSTAKPVSTLSVWTLSYCMAW